MWVESAGRVGGKCLRPGKDQFEASHGSKEWFSVDLVRWKLASKGLCKWGDEMENMVVELGCSLGEAWRN